MRTMLALAADVRMLKGEAKGRIEEKSNSPSGDPIREFDSRSNSIVGEKDRK